MEKFLKYGRNFYVLASLSFLFWMLFIDSNSLSNHYQLTKQLWDLEDQKVFYVEKKAHLLQQQKELTGNPELLEKFAREKYLMKKPTEDLYVVVEK